MRLPIPGLKKALFFLAILSTFLAADCRNAGNPAEIKASGTIEAIEVHVGSKLGGQIQKLLVDEGASVAKGQTLAAIDSSTLELQLNQAEAGVELAAAQLELLFKGARAEDIRQAEEGLKQAEAGFKVAEEDYARVKSLLEKGSATSKQKEDAEARYTVASAQYNAAKEAVAKIRRLSRPEEIKAAQARLSQAKASSELLRKSIADCTIISPLKGIVTHKAVEQGEFVAPGATLLTVINLEDVYLKIYISELDLGKVRLAERASVRIDSYPEKDFTGEVTHISPEAEFTPKNIQTKEERVKLVYAVKIKIKNKTGILKPGMPADATIKEATGGEKN